MGTEGRLPDLDADLEASARVPDGLVNRLLHDEALRARPEALLAAIRAASPRGRTNLHRYVFPDLHGRSPAFDALYAAVTISDDAARGAYLDRLAGALARGDDQALLSLREETAPPELPEGHTVERPHIGSGKTSRVALLRRTADGALFAWKIPADDSAEIHEAMGELIGRSGRWVELGISSAPADWAPDGRTILQPFVSGPSLRHAFREAGLLEDPEHPLLPSLATLFRKIVTAGVMVSGLNTENLIHDGGDWQVIDSGAVKKMKGPRRAWGRQRKKLARHWVRWDGHTARAIGTFLDRIEKQLDLPRPGLSGRFRALFSRR